MFPESQLYALKIRRMLLLSNVFDDYLLHLNGLKPVQKYPTKYIKVPNGPI